MQSRNRNLTSLWNDKIIFWGSVHTTEEAGVEDPSEKNTLVKTKCQTNKSKNRDL